MRVSHVWGSTDVYAREMQRSRVNDSGPCVRTCACLAMHDHPRALTSMCLESHIASRCHGKSIQVKDGQTCFIRLTHTHTQKRGRCSSFHRFQQSAVGWQDGWKTWMLTIVGWGGRKKHQIKMSAVIKAPPTHYNFFPRTYFSKRFWIRTKSKIIIMIIYFLHTSDSGWRCHF